MDIDKQFIVTSTLAIGSLCVLVFMGLGILIARYRRFDLITGYKQCSDEEKSYYDIENLADHIGNGFITMGVLSIISIGFFVLEFYWTSGIFLGLVLFIIAIVLIGVRKFMPTQQKLMKSSPSNARHAFLHWILPRKCFLWLKKQTKLWSMQCHTCGGKQDYWDHGGTRSGVGEPSRLMYCSQCQKMKMHKIRKKSEEEKLTVKGVE